MRFGKTLRGSVYEPWKDKYIDYPKLKALLREDKSEDDGGEPWTEEDENRFCDEIFTVQLEKVAEFQQERFDDLRKRVDNSFDKLKELTPAEGDRDTPRDEASASKLRELEKALDDITNEVKELKKYSNTNYTGFLKIVKKHDRKRGDRYKVRPMMQLSLANRPFNSEQGYAPLLNKLSIMYYAIRQQLEAGELPPLDLESQGQTHNGERYTAHKFWVHPDNLLEVKTLILRRLPALIYSQQSARELDGRDSPAITSLYFDNRKFDLYQAKVDREPSASTLRLRWFGQLNARPEIHVEQKTVNENGDSQEAKFSTKDKYVQSFVKGEDITEKHVSKMERQGQPAETIHQYEETVSKIQGFLREKKLEPVLRANYTRTAFQKPTDDRVRISIDTEVAFIREDTLDSNRPCRDPNEWHRTDIDDSNMEYPFKNINKSEVSKFPFAILEIKLKDDGVRKRPTWVEDLMSSHLVHPAPRFSKFAHGVASLFEDYVNNLPFWLSDLETDIRKDPQQAFEDEEQRRAQRAGDAQAVESLIGTVPTSYRAAQSSPISKSYLADRMAADASARKSLSRSATGNRVVEDRGEGAGEAEGEAEDDALLPSTFAERTGYGTLSSMIPSFSLSKYAKAKRSDRSRLPEGVVRPTTWIKNSGELKVEPKVWLANERTFLKWQHVCLLQGGLAVGLYTAAGGNTLTEVMAVIYLAIAVFTGIWGYAMMRSRRTMIVERSGKDFDNIIGPIIISVGLMIALTINFILQFKQAYARMKKDQDAAMSAMPVTDELI